MSIQQLKTEVKFDDYYNIWPIHTTCILFLMSGTHVPSREELRSIRKLYLKSLSKNPVPVFQRYK